MPSRVAAHFENVSYAKNGFKLLDANLWDAPLFLYQNPRSSLTRSIIREDKNNKEALG